MKIEAYLNEAGVKYEKHEHSTAYTAQEMAAEEHIPGDAVAKCVLVQADERPVVCVLPASHKVDLLKLADALEAAECRLLDETEMARLFPDVEVGAEPPFGRPYGVETLVDAHLAKCRAIVFPAGSHQEAIRMNYEDYAHLEKPRVADFAVHL